MKLSREDWDKLDDLLGKHGFGGYYDLVECLKMVLRKLVPNPPKEWKVESMDLTNVVNALLASCRSSKTCVESR